VSIIVVVAPHPDDETLGCGGVLLRHKAEGDEIHWLIMTSMNVDAGYNNERIDSRASEIKKVSEAYGFSSAHQAKFLTTELDTLPKKDLVNEVSRYFNSVKPDTVYVPFYNDIHSDHRAVFEAVSACTKSFRYPFLHRVRAYETLSETEFCIEQGHAGFQPNLWIDITGYIDQKIEIMNIYQGEMNEHPFPRSEQNIRALSLFRGARVGVENAESFMSLLEII
jgi:N-acetylglucosamine malate deacetylase 1